MYGGHKHAWVHVDAGVVGCRLCGVVHVCELGNGNVVGCELEYTDEGSCVCALTALELRCSMFMDEQLDVESYNRNRGTTYAAGSSGVDRHSKNFQENVQVLYALRMHRTTQMQVRAPDRASVCADNLRHRARRRAPVALFRDSKGLAAR